MMTVPFASIHVAARGSIAFDGMMTVPFASITVPIETVGWRSTSVSVTYSTATTDFTRSAQSAGKSAARNALETEQTIENSGTKKWRRVMFENVERDAAITLHFEERGRRLCV